MTTTTTMATMATTPTPAPATDILALLHRYQSLRAAADGDLKSSVFNITVARRGRSYQLGGGFGGVEFSAEDVREELRARALLEWRGKKEESSGKSGSVVDGNVDDGEPTLLDETTSGGDDDDDDDVKEDDGGDDCIGSGSSSGRFVLHLDGMKASAQQQQQQQQQRRAEDSPPSGQNTASSNDDKENEGLRRRRGGNENSDDRGSDDRKSNNRWTVEEPDDDMRDEEEERLRNVEPLALFGVPPPALRVAQAKSRSAVAYYVEVANLAREIMEMTNAATTTAT